MLFFLRVREKPALIAVPLPLFGAVIHETFECFFVYNATIFSVLSVHPLSTTRSSHGRLCCFAYWVYASSVLAILDCSLYAGIIIDIIFF